MTLAISYSLIAGALLAWIWLAPRFGAWMTTTRA